MGKSANQSQLPNAPAFSAYRSTSNQSLISGAWTKIQCQTEEYDTASAYDNVINFRFTPQVAGLYQVTGTIYCSGAGLTNLAAQIYKNGAGYKNGNNVVQTASTDGAIQVSALISMNGSTDYVELFGLFVGTNPVAVANASGNLTYFQATLVRPA